MRRHRHLRQLARTLLLALLTSLAACKSQGDQPDDEPEESATDSPNAETPGVEWTKRFWVMRGPAQRGPWRMNDSTFFYVDDPTVDLTDEGHAGVAWVDNEDQNVFFQSFTRNGRPLLEEPVDVSRSPEIFSWLPRIAMTGPPEDHVYVLWQEIVFSGGSHGGEAFFARSTDGGETFDDPVNLSNTENGVGKGRLTEEIWHNGSHDITLGPDDTIYVAWTSYQGPLHVARSADDGASFSDPIHVAGDDDTPARAPTLAVGLEGTVYLAWTVGEEDEADLRVTLSEDGARSFQEPSVVLAGEGHADAPKLAVDSERALHLVYGEAPAGMFEAYHVKYARSPEGNLAFDDARRISSPHGDGLASAHFPSLAVDGDDHLFVLWNRYPDADEPPRGLGFVASFDRGDSFVSPSVVPESDASKRGFNGSLQGMLMRKLAANASGQLAAVNSRFQPDEESRIWMYRGEAVAPDE